MGTGTFVVVGGAQTVPTFDENRDFGEKRWMLGRFWLQAGRFSRQVRRVAPFQPPSSLRFRCIWVKRLLQAGVALYTRAV